MSRNVRQYPTVCDDAMIVTAFAGPVEEIDGEPGRRYVQLLIKPARAKLVERQVETLAGQLLDHVRGAQPDPRQEYSAEPENLLVSFEFRDPPDGPRVRIIIGDRWVILVENQVRDLVDVLEARVAGEIGEIESQTIEPETPHKPPGGTINDE